MNPGKVSTHQLIDLAPYWDNRMKACFGYVPLTIFVPAWLLADKNHMSNRRKQSLSCSDVIAYVGLRVPSKWRHSFLIWSTFFHLYVKYWRLKYQQEEIANTPSGRHQVQPQNGQFFGEANHHYGYHHQDNAEASGSVGYHQSNRGRGKQGRGMGRGTSSRGGSIRGGSHSGPTTIVNGVMVTKFGPGAFEAVKAARQASVNGKNAGTQKLSAGKDQYQM
ncbi:uncharacterized protein MELLADRAFT_110640 [Melampsora larici-populina 98AG31]|uniref:Uncharacterized protein n=1 Tax=Melampsora larici-populina (strain 98AG31 / pathotype 3-4-7) TaxID=747676 RepID=F4S0G6_MELLP|nr:uncharacterized protein MELLADRAFT_110640 [Melampsora larici-populina 98AG31]EGG01763.1 hypothetical protein MELLADRAFT_110640 [Melampsora larici-populina 98AG31]